MKKEIKIEEGLPFNLDGPISAVTQRLLDYRKQKESEGWTAICMDVDVNHGYYDVEIKVFATRYETDVEEKKRLANNVKKRAARKKAAATRKARDLKEETELYEKLKKKLGKVT